MPINDIKLPVATDRKTKLDLSCEHLTTMNFMCLQPVFYRHMIKGEHLNFDAVATCRPAPIELPIFGRMRLNMRGFFVPYSLVFPNWHDFYNDTIASNADYSSLVSGVPTFTTETLRQLFMDPNYELLLINDVNPDFDDDLPVSASNYPYLGDGDLYLSDETPNHQAYYVPYRYTTAGRRILKLLESLGYRFIMPNGSDIKNNRIITFNALALLAYAKVYVDWFSNKQYLNSVDVLTIERLLKFNDPTSSLSLSAADMYSILTLTGVTCYDNESYYVGAWDNPVNPNSGVFSTLQFSDITIHDNPNYNASGKVVMNNTGNLYSTPTMVQNSSNQPYLGTTYLHEALKRLTDFQKRHALGGARAIDRVLAQYGIVTDSLRMQRSIYVGCQSIDINIGTVMGTANGSDGTKTSSVGDFAGTAFGQGSKSWDFQNDDEGIFIVMASIQPTAQFVQGYDRNNRHLDKTQFFVPEFDALGVAAIEKGEVYTSLHDDFADDITKYLSAFGFTGRYGEYKRSRSNITGDLSPSVPSHYNGASAWHLARLFSDYSFGSIAGVSHSLNFTRGVDRAQFDRIFQYTDVDFDKFYVDFHFDVGVYAPCRPLFETYDFEENGDKVTIAQGTGLN